MTTLVLTPVPDFGGVRVSIDAAPAGPVTIMRTDSNGVNEVRLLAGQEPIGGTLIVMDYEAALYGSLTYKVIDASSAEIIAVTSLAGLVTEPIVSVPVLPQKQARVKALIGYGHSRDSNAVVHNPLSRTEPIVIGGTLRCRTGSVDIFVDSFADGRAVETVLAGGETALIRQADHDGMDMYFMPLSTRLDVLSAQNDNVDWRLTVEFAESGTPDGSLHGAFGWTFADLLEQYATCSDVDAGFVDFNALVVGP